MAEGSCCRSLLAGGRQFKFAFRWPFAKLRLVCLGGPVGANHKVGHAMEPSARHSYLLLAGCLWAVWVRRVFIRRPIATPCKCSPSPTPPDSDLHSIHRPDRGEEFISVFLLSRWRGNPCLS